MYKSSDKSKHWYNDYGIAADWVSSWSFGDDFATNALIFGVDNSPSPHIDNCKNKFLVLGEGSTNGTNDKVVTVEKRFNIYISNPKTKFCWSLHYNGDNSYLFLNRRDIYKFKADNKNVSLTNSVFSRKHIWNIWCCWI